MATTSRVTSQVELPWAEASKPGSTIRIAPLRQRFTPDKLTSESFALIAIVIGILLFSWYVSTAIVTPTSWGNFLQWLYDCFVYTSRFPHTGFEYFLGQRINLENLPWYYLPVWLIISTPLVIQVFAVVGVISFALRFKQESVLAKLLFLMLGLQLLLLPVLAILLSSTIYNGFRQFYFILPPLAIVSAYGCVRLGQWLSHRVARLGYLALVSVLLVQIGIDMAAIHPYTSIYFDTRTWGDEVTEQFSTDYWALGNREVMDWANENLPKNSLVMVQGLWQTFFAHADKQFFLARYSEWIPLPHLNFLKSFGYEYFLGDKNLKNLEETIEPNEWKKLQVQLEKAEAMPNWNDAFYVILSLEVPTTEFADCTVIYQSRTSLTTDKSVLKCDVESVPMPDESQTPS